MGVVALLCLRKQEAPLCLALQNKWKTTEKLNGPVILIAKSLFFFLVLSMEAMDLFRIRMPFVCLLIAQKLIKKCFD